MILRAARARSQHVGSQSGTRRKQSVGLSSFRAERPSATVTAINGVAARTVASES
jgi:hypothetical protein